MPTTRAISPLERPAKLQRDQLALARPEPVEGGVEEEAQLLAGLLGRRHARRVGGIGAERGLAAATAQLVQRGVAGDAEEPGAGAAPLGVEAGALAVGPLEGRRGHVLGRRAVAQQPGGVGVDVVAAGAVQALEVEVALRMGSGARNGCLAHALTTGESRICHSRRLRRSE